MIGVPMRLIFAVVVCLNLSSISVYAAKELPRSCKARMNETAGEKVPEPREAKHIRLNDDLKEIAVKKRGSQITLLQSDGKKLSFNLKPFSWMHGTDDRGYEKSFPDSNDSPVGVLELTTAKGETKVIKLPGLIDDRFRVANGPMNIRTSQAFVFEGEGHIPYFLYDDGIDADPVLVNLKVGKLIRVPKKYQTQPMMKASPPSYVSEFNENGDLVAYLYYGGWRIRKQGDKPVALFNFMTGEVSDLGSLPPAFYKFKKIGKELHLVDEDKEYAFDVTDKTPELISGDDLANGKVVKYAPFRTKFDYKEFQRRLWDKYNRNVSKLYDLLIDKQPSSDDYENPEGVSPKGPFLWANPKSYLPPWIKEGSLEANTLIQDMIHLIYIYLPEKAIKANPKLIGLTLKELEFYTNFGPKARS